MIISGIKRLFGGVRSGPNGSNVSRPQPEVPVAIVGDIHGRADLLDKVLAKINRTMPDATIILVGDYVDRGPDSRLVLETVQDLAGVICLTGNHEVMMLEFLDHPIECGGRWVRNGGTQTLASYGIDLSEASGHNEVVAASQKLRDLLADGTEHWLRGLALCWASGNLVINHAGPDPARAIDGQEDDVFLWGHNRFLRDSRTDGVWVAHGHWIRDKGGCSNGRISVDTGAWKSGKLTAALVKPDGTVKFITT